MKKQSAIAVDFKVPHVNFSATHADVLAKSERAMAWAENQFGKGVVNFTLPKSGLLEMMDKLGAEGYTFG